MPIAVLNWVKSDPDLDPIRDHPRFKPCLRQPKRVSAIVGASANYNLTPSGPAVQEEQRIKPISGTARPRLPKAISSVGGGALKILMIARYRHEHQHAPDAVSHVIIFLALPVSDQRNWSVRVTDTDGLPRVEVITTIPTV